MLPTLDSQRLRLRTPQIADSGDLFRVFSHPEAMRYWSSTPYEDPQKAVDLVKEIHQLCESKALYQWGIEWREEQRLIGTCTLAGLDWSNGRCEVGFILHPDYWRKGIISEALSTLFQHAFDDLKMRRIEADVDPKNIASVRTLERMGFQREGLLRERWNVGGDIQDSLFYGLLKSDWEQRLQQQES